ncbi:MAG: hypothetical protein KAJ75_00035, partial [Alphaproteobacteria bacterium]|nr:hypothetical protein [Alphaproteobacteria bacterium]
MKMTDKEVIDKASELSKEHGLSRSEMSAVRISIVQDKPNKTLDEIDNKAKIARYNVPLSKEEVDMEYKMQADQANAMRTMMLKKQLGVTEVMGTPTPQQMQQMAMQQAATGFAISSFVDGVIDKISENGCDSKALLKVVGQEKDAIRKTATKDPLGDMKIQTLNGAFLMDPTMMVQVAKARKSVNEAISAVPVNLPEMTSTKALATFIGGEMQLAKMVYVNLDLAEKRTPDMPVHDQMASMTKEHQIYTQTLMFERGSQELAKTICKNKSLFEQVKKEVPMLADMIEKKANLKHNGFVDSNHMLFSNNDQKMVKSVKGIVGQKLQMMAAMVQNQPMVQAVMSQNNPAVAKSQNVDIAKVATPSMPMPSYSEFVQTKQPKNNKIQRAFLKDKRRSR